jgi:copper transport protein
VPAVAVHLLAVGVWVGGLGALVVLGGRAWRRLPDGQRAELLGHLVPRFTRLAVVAVAVVLASGVVNALGNLAAPSDLWRLSYGRVLGAKVALLAVALVLGARHRRVVPRRLADRAVASGAVASFQRSAAAELGVLAATVALAAGLVALVPGRSLALAAKGPVNQERGAGGYTVQLFVDPTTVGANQVHLTFVNAQGLGAAEVANATAALGASDAAATPVPMRLISPGHFVGDVTLPAPGRYRLSVAVGAEPTGPSTTFQFRLSGSRVGKR